MPKLPSVEESPPSRKRSKQQLPGNSSKKSPSESPPSTKRSKQQLPGNNSKKSPSESPSRKRIKHIVMFTGYDDPQVFNLKMTSLRGINTAIN